MKSKRKKVASRQLAPRNHVVLALLKRASGDGAHGQTDKALRRQDKVALLRVCRLIDAGVLLMAFLKCHVPNPCDHSERGVAC